MKSPLRIGLLSIIFSLALSCSSTNIADDNGAEPATERVEDSGDEHPVNEQPGDDSQESEQTGKTIEVESIGIEEALDDDDQRLGEDIGDDAGDMPVGLMGDRPHDPRPDGDGDEPRRSQFELSALQTQSACDRASVRQTINSMRSSFKACHDRSRERDEPGQSTLSLRWTIAATGAVDDISITDEGDAGQTLQTCVTRVLDNMVMAEPQQSCDVDADFEFSIADSEDS